MRESTLPAPCECLALSDSIKVRKRIGTSKQIRFFYSEKNPYLCTNKNKNNMNNVIPCVECFKGKVRPNFTDTRLGQCDQCGTVFVYVGVNATVYKESNLGRQALAGTTATPADTDAILAKAIAKDEAEQAKPMLKFNFTVMSTDGTQSEDPHQKYDFDAEGRTMEEAVQNCLDYFHNGYQHLPVHWIEYYENGRTRTVYNGD